MSNRLHEEEKGEEESTQYIEVPTDGNFWTMLNDVQTILTLLDYYNVIELDWYSTDKNIRSYAESVKNRAADRRRQRKEHDNI